MKEERLLPVGTKVFDVRYGWGEIQSVYTCDTFPLLTWFHDYEIGTSYTLDGKVLKENLTPMLSLTEYTLETGGFMPISEYWNNPQIGDWGYFWDMEFEGIHFSGLRKIQEDEFPYISTSGFKWRHFSKEMPNHILKQMEQK